MTEQSKIPMPPGGGNGGGGNEPQSLLERASEAYGLGQFRPAPMPAALAQEPGRITRRRQAREQARIGAEANPGPVPSAGVRAPGQADGAPLVVPAEPVEPVRFTSERQAIDRARLAEQGMIVPGEAVTTLFEEFRIVKRQLLNAAAAAMQTQGPGRAQRILVSSPLPGEGKTFCATNLALALAAERDSEVLLVDADFAKPSILSTLGLAGREGLMDALANPAIKVEDCVIGTDVPGLWVLPAGNRTNSDSEYLASARTAQVLDRLTQGVPNRLVIFDTPPALAATVAGELAKYVGQVAVVVRADQTGQSALEDALRLLAVCPDIKLLLNDAHFSPSGRRFGDYYGYGG